MDSFTIEATKGAIEGVTSLSIVVVTGSSSQLLLEDCLISFIISSTENFLNQVRTVVVLISDDLWMDVLEVFPYILNFVNEEFVKSFC